MDTAAIFKAYDIRGTYPDQIDERLARAVGSAFATFVDGAAAWSSRATCAPRGWRSGRRLRRGRARRWASRSLDLGLASTDFLYFASGFLDAPGAMFTASHNPAQYNGIKLCLRRGAPDRRRDRASSRSRR